MNISDIHALSNHEIVESLARMNGAPIEKSLQAELQVRFIQAVIDLNRSVCALAAAIEKIPVDPLNNGRE